MDFNLLFSQMAKKHKSSPVKTFADLDLSLSYIDIAEKSNLLAHWLLQQGLKKGDHFGIWMGNVPEFVLLMAASLRIGTVIVPFSTYEPFSTIEELCIESNCKYLIYDSNNKDVKKNTISAIDGCSLIDLAASERKDGIRFNFCETNSPSTELVCETALSDDILICYTSGSTGEKKGVRKSVSSYFGSGDFFKKYARAHDVAHYVYPLHLFNLCPWYHNTGLYALYIALCGCYFHEITAERYSPVIALNGIKKYKPNIWVGTATMLYRCCLLSPDKNIFLPRIIISTGEALQGYVIKKLEEYRGASLIISAYGTTEVGVVTLLLCKLKKMPLFLKAVTRVVHKKGLVKSVIDSTYFDESTKETYLGSIAKNKTVLIYDDATASALPDGESGEICIKGSTEMNGYLKSKASSIYVNYNDEVYLRTGDLGCKKENDLYLTGRKKNMIIRSGENILPHEIEQVVQQYAGVRAAVACGIPSKEYGEEICLCIETHEKNFDLEGLQQEIRDKLPKYMYPQYFMLWDTFPTNHSHKTDRIQIRNKAINDLTSKE